MSNHYIVLADHGHLRIFEQRSPTGQSTPGLVEVDAMDFPQGKKSYTDSDTDMAGRFQGSKQQGRGPGSPVARTGMSIDERLPMQREVERRSIDDVVVAIESFLQAQPDATWDFAAGPQMHNAVLGELAPKTKARLQRSLSKDLVHLPIAELLAHFDAGSA
jgi:hypothetical protein